MQCIFLCQWHALHCNKLNSDDGRGVGVPVAGTVTVAVRLPRAYKYGLQGVYFRERPYHAERTGTHSNAEVLKAVSGSVSTSEGDLLGTLSAAHQQSLSLSLFFFP